MPRQTDWTLHQDSSAYDLRQQGLSWAEIATQLHLSQESVARASARRHARRIGDASYNINSSRRLAGQTAARIRHQRRPALPTAMRTFGVEIEFKTAQKFLVAREVADALGVGHIHCFRYHDLRCQICHELVPDQERYSQWKIEKDGSVTDERNGVEYGGEVVSPILSIADGGLEQINKVTKALKQAGATVNRRCGLHVHISVKDFSNTERANIMRMWQYAERVIENFVATSRINNYYCGRWNNRPQAIRDLEAGNNLNYPKMYNLNIAPFNTPKKTFEVRLHQGTLSGVKITTWVKFLLAFFTNSASTSQTADFGQTEIPITRIADVQPIHGRENFDEKPMLQTLVAKGFLENRDMDYLTQRAENFKQRMVV